MLKKEKERMTNQTQEQVVDNSNTSSETIKNHYVVSDVKSDNEVIFDIYPTDMSKKVSWGIVADEGEYEEGIEKVFLTENSAKEGIDEFKKEKVAWESVKDEIEDRLHDNYFIHAEEDENNEISVEERDIETSYKKMSVSDYINKEIEKHDKRYWFGDVDKNSSRTKKENQIMKWLNNGGQLPFGYECVRLVSDNLVTFGLIKKEKIDENKSN